MACGDGSSQILQTLHSDTGWKFTFCSKHRGKSLKECKQWRDIIHVFKQSLWLLREKMNWKRNKNETGASWEVVAMVDMRAQFPWFHPLVGIRVVAM